LTIKYTKPEEDKEIIEKYISGLYTYQDLADMYNLSKSTIINIVKGYPYNKRGRGRKVENELLERLKLERLNAQREAWDAFAKCQWIKFGHFATEWEKFTHIIGDNAKNPWGIISKNSGARTRSKGLQYTPLEKYEQIGMKIEFPDSGSA